MAFQFDSKYDENSTVVGESTIQFFPDISQFEPDFSEQPVEESSLSEWALVKIGTLQSRLETIQSELGRRHKNSRFTPKIANHVIMNLANEVFGYDGWSSEIMHFDINVDESQDDVVSGKAIAMVRVKLRDGMYRESVGYASAMKLPHKYMCYNNCRKQAVSNATSKAILSFTHLLLDYEIKVKLESLL
jgi:DNA repair protein RAD59